MLKIKSLSGHKKHRKILEINDEESGLHGFIAIHNENLGPAVGGTRMHLYKSRREALKDALRLSEAMTYKCALAGISCGGGKGVIIADSSKYKSKKLLKSYALAINYLRGEFFTGEDVGISEKNVQYMLKHSPYFIGKRGFAGDPSPFASLSVFYSMQAASKWVFGTESLRKLRIAVKGVGKVGGELVRLLVENGAEVFISDIKSSAIKRIIQKHPEVKIIDNEKIAFLNVDIFAPCALGNEFTIKNYKEIKAKIICGGANNQLSRRQIGEKLHGRGILYIPDYVANSGGLINVADELERGGYKSERVLRRIKNVKKTVHKIITLSQKLHRSTNRISDKLAEEIFAPSFRKTLFH